MKLNADIGESYGKWSLGEDAEVMPLIDQANIACGYHAGDALTMQETIRLAKAHNVEIGAHVSYPDIQGFGRRSMQLSSTELMAMIQAQIATLEGLAKCQNTKVAYVKPHGALYNDMMKDIDIFTIIVKALSTYHISLDLLIQALPDNSKYIDIATAHGLKLRFEAFSDRAYTTEGLLVSRTKDNAMLNQEDSLKQVVSMIENRPFLSESNTALELNIDTICVHSDSPAALHLCREIRAILSKNSDNE